MRSTRKLLLLALLALFPVEPSAQQAPRQLSQDDMAKLRSNVEASRARSIEAQKQVELQRQQDELRRQEEALADDGDDWGDDTPQQTSAGGFADVMNTFANTLNSEMAKKQQEQARQQRFLDNIRREAEAVEHRRQRDLERQRLADERARLDRIEQQRQQAAVQSSGGGDRSLQRTPSTAAAAAATAQQQAAHAQEEKLRASVAAERQRQQQVRDQQEASRVERERKLAAEGKAVADRQRAGEQRRLATAQATQQAAQNLRTTFRGAAITCPGGGKDVLYLRSSSPPKTGCNVAFEARCPGTASGNGVHFSHANYIGASCGMGDNIRIGPMSCAADQVSIRMTQADCG